MNLIWQGIILKKEEEKNWEISINQKPQRHNKYGSCGMCSCGVWWILGRTLVI